MPFDQSELLEKSPLCVVISDKSERIIWCNSQFLTDSHQTEDSVIGKLYPSLPLEAIDKNTQTVQLFSENASDKVKFQYWQENLQTPAGAKAHYFVKERCIPDKLSLVAAKLEGSGLPKRASWIEFLDYEVSRSRRYDNPLSLLKLHLFVLDKPQGVNEETLHGRVMDTLMDELRWADMIGHTDQGTFLIVLPETPEEALIALQDKLRKAIEGQLDLINNDVDQVINYRIVFGQAVWQKHDDSHRLLKKARDNLVSKLEALLGTETPKRESRT